MKYILGSNSICAIKYYNRDDFDLGVIVNKNNDEIVFVDFNIYGEYNGIVYQNHRKIKKISFEGKYISFMKKIINFNYKNIILLYDKIDFIRYAFSNNRILGIVSLNQENDVIIDVKILEFDEVSIKCQSYTRCGKLDKSVTKIQISDILMMQIDSKYQRLIEKINKFK